MPDSTETPLIVMAAPNGARLGKSEHSEIPLTPSELADCAEKLLKLNVSVLHLHVRDEQGVHSLSAAHYRPALDAIRERIGDQMILQVTTEAVGMYSARDQMSLVRELRPEAVSLSLRELCPDQSSETEATRFFQELREIGIWPQYILYSPAEARRFELMRQNGAFGEEHPFALYVLGNYAQARPGSVTELDTFFASSGLPAYPWAACCFGPEEAVVMREAAARGGHVRMGFENNRSLPDGNEARDNAQLLEQGLSLLAPRPFASAGWIRKNML